VLVGACFLVNYVTADSKTNWAEGMALVVFYFMIVSLLHKFQCPNVTIIDQALSAWYYTGQPEMDFMSQCDSVAEAIHTFTEYGTLDL
jgi:Ca2+:H+ antiporter